MQRRSGETSIWPYRNPFIAMCLSDIIQMKGGQVFNGQKVCGGGRKGNDDLQIALAPVANFHPHLALCIVNCSGMLYIIPSHE